MRPPIEASKSPKLPVLAKMGDEIGLTMDVLASGRSQIVSALVPIPSAQARLHPLIAVRVGSYGKLVAQVAEFSSDLGNERCDFTLSS